MCVNFLPPSRYQLTAHFGVLPPDHDWAAEAWQDHAAPIIVDVGNGPQAIVGSYGMVPRRHLPHGRKPYSTMNARSETLAERPAYRGAWRVGQYCLIPMQGFFEPNYESGKAERWQIGLADDAPFAVAGLWRSWSERDGSVGYSFTQLTINADTHPLMRRFHPPEEEKRSLVIVPASAWQAWLRCRDAGEARHHLRPYPVEQMTAFAAPLPSQQQREQQQMLF